MPALLGTTNQYSALWSLSVEEQFYLLWPLIIRKLSRRGFTLSRPLIFLAKISYGLYLCHPFLFNLIDKHWPLHSPSTPAFYYQLLLRFIVEAALSIAVATLSRYTIEAYFLRRKPRHHRNPRLHSVLPKIA
jgi:peptidoglycan/LPS O-acetylase OafA/YrhL